MTTAQDPASAVFPNKMAEIKEEEEPSTETTATSKSSEFTFSQEVPIFLKKTWAMIDSCTEPDICGWNDDDNGESFVVKDPKRFESEIIPQFFKHSKFTSFVRQLNFYSFRKIKFGDGIRFDPEAEIKNKNFWRFYHEKFRKGRPDWLIHVKRTVHGARGGAGSTSHASGGRTTAASPTKNAVTNKDAVVENQQLKTEVSSLKERIDAMTKNIDQLTTMVQQVTLKQTNDNDNDSQCSDDSSLRRRRRPRKVVVLNEQTSLSATAYVDDHVADTITSSSSSPSADAVADDVAMPDISSVTSLGNVHSFMPLPPSSPGLPSPAKFDDGSMYYNGTADGGRVTSGSELSDQGFVDQLLTAFKEEDTSSIDFVDRELLDVAFDDNDADVANNTSSTPQSKVGGRRNTAVSPVSSPAFAAVTDDDNRPREELMRRLSDALSLLPRNVQELIVDRLIHAITSPQEIQDSLKVARALEEVITATTSSSFSPAEPLSPTEVPHNDDEHDVAMEDSGASVGEEAEAQQEVAPAAPTNTPTATPPPSLPLAAATLAALLSQYNQKQAAAAAAAAASSASNNDVDGHHHHDDDEHHHEVSEAQRKSKRIAAKSLLIPVHA
eukprot:CAMPEP_0113451780 /NCGR_PEP_ID=MMETSP0014_2-20120614/6512_1 /TAXON_ID=2857 /ORGANISM="Nitzschia sp." /LENGTH=609 /DNA_ID=CAMNT_0000343141 /DNA_START=89 /DNA_END=1918 /DNA_ORIENTATION=+ /assembly_acc=CAM_ASM_000159